MRRYALAAALALFLVALALPGSAFADARSFNAVVGSILAQRYQPDYVPQGNDSAFPGSVANTLPAEDYTTGSIPDSPDLPPWPPWFHQILLHSGDGAPFFAQVALRSGKHPGIVVVHGFNTHGYESVIRWAAMLYANGYNVIAADQRDFSYESSAGLGDPTWQQTFGWKESQDVLAAGRYLASQSGVNGVGVVGFSEGGQNTVLTLALDAQSKTPVFKAGLQFSGPADQDSQIYSTAFPAGCATPFCTYPLTDALVELVVPPYDQPDVCTVLGNSAALYHTDGFSILSHESAFHAQTHVKVPLLSFYSADDSLVAPFQATMMAAYESGNPIQRTVELQRGEHAYFFDRWWDQKAILLYFKSQLPSATGDKTVTTTPTVNQTSGGGSAGSQQVALGSPTRASADAQLAPYICDTTRGAPGKAGGS